MASFLPLIAIVAIFYFLVFMPMQKQKKQQAQMLADLQAGAEVLTTGGIVGTIVSITGDMLILRVKPDNIKLQVSRASVASLVKQESSDRGKEVNHELTLHMTSNLKIKILVIVVVILACIYGIIGLPTSKEAVGRRTGRRISTWGWISRAAASWCCRCRSRTPSRPKPIP